MSQLASVMTEERAFDLIRGTLRGSAQPLASLGVLQPGPW